MYRGIEVLRIDERGTDTRTLDLIPTAISQSVETSAEYKKNPVAKSGETAWLTTYAAPSLSQFLLPMSFDDIPFLSFFYS